jgi:tetratricopeptide (TPR) repeat protein
MRPFFTSLPEALWPEVNRRLHQLPALWELTALPGMTQAFLDLGDDLELWQPVQLGLAALSVLEPASTADPVQWLKAQGREKLAKAYNGLTDPEGAEKKEAKPLPEFVQATLAAVALQQRYTATNDIDSIVRDAAAAPDAWTLPLVCLYGLLDDPQTLIAALFREAARHTQGLSQSLLELAAQILVANEAPADLEEPLQDYAKSAPPAARLTLARFFTTQNLGALAKAAAGSEATNPAPVLNINLQSTLPSDLPVLFRTLSESLESIFLSEYIDPAASRTKLGRLVEAGQSLSAELALLLGHRSLAQGDSISALAAFQEAQALRPYDKQMHALIAEAAAQRGDAQTAQVALGQAAKSKTPPSSSLAAARAQHKLGNSAQAKAIVRRLVTTGAKAVKESVAIDASNIVAAAKLLSSLSDHEAALSAWQQVTVDQPTNAQAYSSAAAHALSLQQSEQAADLAWQAVGLAPTDAPARKTLAVALAKSGDAAGSLEQWQRVVTLDPQPQSRLKLAEAALAASDYDLAFATANQLLHDPDAETLNKGGLPYIMAGRALTAQAQPDKAFEYFNKAVSLAPASVESWRAVAAHHKAAGDSQKALAALDAGRHLINPDTVEAADFYADLGDLRADLHHLTEATNAFEKAIQLQPDRIDLLKRLGQLYRLQNKLPAAVEVIGKAAQVSSKDPALFHLLGQLLESSGRFPDALAAYRRAQTIEGASIELHRDLGRLAYQLSEITIARPVFEKILSGRDKFDAADLDSLVLLGAIYEHAGEFSPALAVYKHAIALDPLRSDLCVRLGLCCLELGQPETALAALKDAAERDLDNYELQKVMGNAYASAQLWLEAMLAYEQASHLAPDDHALLSSLAKAARQAGEPGRAVDALQKAIALAPDSAKYRHALGELYIGLQQVQEAKALYAESCRVLPEAVDLWMGLGQTQLMLNEVPDAARAFEKAVTLKPNDVNAIQAVGETQAQLGNYEPAHAAFARAAELDPANPAPLRRAGDCMWELGREAMALALWRKVLVTHPQDTASHARLGSALAKQGQNTEALVELELATKSAPNDAKLAVETAKVALQVGETEKSIAHLERASQAKADDPEIWQLLSQAFQSKGKLHEALTAIRKAIRLAPGSAPAHAAVAQLLAEGGNLPEAITAAEAALKAGPDDPIVLAAVGQVFVQAGRYSEAVAATSKVAAACPNNASSHLALARASILNLNADNPDLGSSEGPQAKVLAPKAKVMQSLEKAAALGADEMEVKEWTGRARVLFGDLEEALPLLEAAAATRPSADLLRSLASCYRRLDRLPLARQACLSALEKNQTSLLTLIELGLVCLAQNDKTAARAAFQRAIGIDVHYAPAYQLLADTMISLGERSEAITIYNQALGLDPARAAWHHRLAELYDAARDAASALAHYQRAATLAVEQNLPGKETANYLAALARAHARDNDLESACKEFEAAITLSSDVPAWWSQFARINFELKSYEKAYEGFSKACELQPNDTASFMGAARSALALGRGEEAEENAISVLRQNPDNYDALIVMGEAFEGRNDYANALIAYTHAVDHAPQPVPAMRAQARLLRTLQQPDAAINILQKLVDLSPEDDECWAALSEAQAEAGVSGKAIELSQRAIQIAPRKAKHHVGLGKLYREAGQLDAALGQLQQAFDLDPSNSTALCEMAQVFEGRRQFNRAYEIYQQLMTLEPDNADHFFRAGLALKEMRDYLDALALFQQAVKLDPKNIEAQHQRAAVAAFGILKGKS